MKRISSNIHSAKKEQIMSKLISICAYCILLFAVSCSDDSNTGPEVSNKYTALKKAKYTNCEITLGEHSYTYVFANPDSIWFTGTQLSIFHKDLIYQYLGQTYYHEGDQADAKIYFDFETSQILFLEYSYMMFHDRNEDHESYYEGYDHDTIISAKIVRIPFYISSDSVITAEISNDELNKKIIDYGYHVRHYIRRKDNNSRLDTVFTSLPQTRNLFKLKVW